MKTVDSIMTDLPVGDGKILLSPGLLKSFRKELGISQEQLALECQEQGLCVSISSVKRAETGKRVLYRTARDLSRFFQISIDALTLSQETSGETLSAALPETRRVIVWLGRYKELGSSVLSDDTRNVISDIFAKTAEKYGGLLYCFEQDYALVLFGVPVAYGNDVARALAAARELHAYSKNARSHELPSNWGLSSSLYVMDLVSDKHLLTESQQALGGYELDSKSIADMVTFNQQLDLDIISVDRDIATSAPGACKFNISNQIEVSSLPPVIYYEWQSQAGQTESLLVGRRRESEQFKSVLNSCLSFNEGQMVLMRSAAGIGKTRMVEEFRRLSMAQNVDFVVGHVLDFGAEQGYDALSCVLRGLFEMHGFDSTQAIVSRFKHWLDKGVFAPEDQGYFYDLLNMEQPESVRIIMNTLDHQSSAESRRVVVQKILAQLIPAHPCVLCFEDIHWADDTLLDMLRCIADELPSLGFVLLLTSRPDHERLGDYWRATLVDLPCMTIDLTPLHKSESAQLAKHLYQHDDEWITHCVAQASGNPLFLEQLLVMQPQDPNKLPQTIHSLVLSRLDKLEPSDKAIIRMASVLGQRFSLAALQAVAGRTDIDCDKLIRLYLIKPAGDWYLFSHALVAKGVYHSIAAKQRSTLHRKAADWYRDKDLVLTARHLQRAGVPEAIQAYLDAITEQLKKYHFIQVLALVDEALVIKGVSSALFDFYYLRAQALVHLGRIEEALEQYQQAIEHVVDDSNYALAWLGIADCANTLDRPQQTQDALDQALNYAQRGDQKTLISKIYYLRGNTYFPSGQIHICREYHNKALSYARQAKCCLSEARALSGLGDAAYAQGKMKSAYKIFDQCLTLCDRHQLIEVEAANRFMLGTVRIYQLESDEALADSLNSAETALSVGHKRAEIVSRLTAGWILLANNEINEAEEQVLLALDIAKEIGAIRFQAFLSESLCRVQLARGELVQANKTITNALEQVTDNGLETFIGPWLMGTLAKSANNAEAARLALKQGENCLDLGCVGHNYYRFYTAAIEVSLVWQRADEAKRYSRLLDTYTKEEPTPWSSFYIARGLTLASVLSGGLTESNSRELQRLKQVASQSHLLEACSAIDKYLLRPDLVSSP